MTIIYVGVHDWTIAHDGWVSLVGLVRIILYLTKADLKTVLKQNGIRDTNITYARVQPITWCATTWSYPPLQCIQSEIESIASIQKCYCKQNAWVSRIPSVMMKYWISNEWHVMFVCIHARVVSLGEVDWIPQHWSNPETIYYITTFSNFSTPRQISSPTGFTYRYHTGIPPWYTSLVWISPQREFPEYITLFCGNALYWVYYIRTSINPMIFHPSGFQLMIRWWIQWEFYFILFVIRCIPSKQLSSVNFQTSVWTFQRYSSTNVLRLTFH